MHFKWNVRLGLKLIIIYIILLLALVSSFGQKKEEKGSEYGKVTLRGGAISTVSVAVRLNAIVTDSKGNLVTGLKRQNFTVYENGDPQQVIYFGADSDPVAVTLVVEFSSSSDITLQEIRDSAYMLLKSLRPNDWCALVEFSNRPKIICDFTRNKDLVLNKIASMQFAAFPGIEMLKTIDFVVNRMMGIPGKKAIVLISTGLSEDAAMLKRLSKKLKGSGIPIYTVSVGFHIRNRYSAILSPNLNMRLLQADSRMRTLAKSSGGIAFFPQSNMGIVNDFKVISLYLRSQYLLAYSPPNPRKMNKKRKISIEASADIDHDGIPDKLKVIHVKEYTLKSLRGKRKLIQ